MILKWIADRKLRGTYVDVGAHIGNHSLFFAAFCPSTKLISIEGHPEIRSLMVGNLKRNLTPEEFAKVHIYHGAAWSKRNEEVWFAPIPRNNAGHCHIAGSGGRGPEEAKTRQTTVTVDDCVGASSVNKLAVLKIDVEDTEHEVIVGAVESIDKHRPLIIIERHDEKQLNDTLTQLQLFDYRVTAEWKGVHTFALESK